MPVHIAGSSEAVFDSEKEHRSKRFFGAMVEARQAYPGTLADVSPDPLGHNSYRLPIHERRWAIKKTHKKSLQP
jgi:hypothetical protein